MPGLLKILTELYSRPSSLMAKYRPASVPWMTTTPLSTALSFKTTERRKSWVELQLYKHGELSFLGREKQQIWDFCVSSKHYLNVFTLSSNQLTGEWIEDVSTITVLALQCNDYMNEGESRVSWKENKAAPKLTKYICCLVSRQRQSVGWYQL